ncbi:MAG: hypothetical protein ACRERD_34220 [Candidatus Binatia bacterium]
MDILIWINTLVILSVAIAMAVLLFAGLREARKAAEATSHSLEVITNSLARVEQMSLEALSRLPQR